MSTEHEPIVLSVDMGEGGPMSEFKRILDEANDAMARALLGNALLTEPPNGGSYHAMRIHEDVRREMMRGKR